MRSSTSNPSQRNDRKINPSHRNDRKINPSHRNDRKASRRVLCELLASAGRDALKIDKRSRAGRPQDQRTTHPIGMIARSTPPTGMIARRPAGFCASRSPAPGGTPSRSTNGAGRDALEINKRSRAGRPKDQRTTHPIGMIARSTPPIGMIARRPAGFCASRSPAPGGTPWRSKYAMIRRPSRPSPPRARSDPALRSGRRRFPPARPASRSVRW